MQKPLSEVAEEAIEIYASHEHASYYDSMFDAGEFSEPAHARRADAEVKDLAEKYGYTWAQVTNEITRLCNEDWAEEPVQDPILPF